MRLTGISSMATRQVLADLVGAFERQTDTPVHLESVGGVDAARRVQAGEPFDLVILASDAIDRLIASGHVQPGSRVDLVRSPVAVAVKAGAPRPDIATEEQLRQAVLAAPRIGFSTGPSGDFLARLFARWGLTDTLQGRTVTPPPGVPVGQLVADGTVDLGFQQLSELMHLDGVQVLGQLPPGADFITTFSAGLCTGSTQVKSAQALLRYLTAPATAAAKRRHGMEPA
jgi:molybdate transport system substrate-binding protein